MLHPALDEAFDDLLTSFRVHDDLRRDPATSLARLARSRVALDRARSRVHRLRMALHPYGNDLELIGRVVLCERIDQIVHVPLLDIERDGSTVRFTCVCGELVERSGEIRPRGDRRATA